MDLIPTNRTLYELVYDPDKDEFIDISPFKKHDRTKPYIEYYCACKSNSAICSYSQWKNHINLKVHDEYRKNYKFFNKPLLDCRRLVIDETRDKHKLINKYKGLKLKYIEKSNEIKTLNEEKIILEKNMESIVKDNYDVREELRVMTEKYNYLQKDMEEINSLVISDSDEEYTDCLEDTDISI
jgi:hypothetical protein